MLGTRANAAGAAIVVLVLPALAATDVRAGLAALLVVCGLASGWTLAYLLTRRARRKKLLALSLLVLTIVLWFGLPTAGLLLDSGWIARFGSTENLSWPYAFGFLMGVGMVAFGRLTGLGGWSDR